MEKQREAGIVPRQVYGMLPCKTCGVEFHKEEGNHRRDCPDCVSDKRMAYYDANRDKFADRNKAKADKRVALHEWIIKYKLDNPCVDCGETRPPTLHFDHIDRSDKIMEVSKMVGQVRPLEMVIAEVAKCDVRCVDCHKIKTGDELGWNVGIDMTLPD